MIYEILLFIFGILAVIGFVLMIYRFIQDNKKNKLEKEVKHGTR